MYIGLSAGSCVRDIVEGNVEMKDVAYILSAGTGDSYRGTLVAMRKGPWRGMAPEATMVFRLLLEAGRIIFLRSDENRSPLLSVAFGNWLRAEQLSGQEIVVQEVIHDGFGPQGSAPEWASDGAEDVEYAVNNLLSSIRQAREAGNG